MLGRVFLGLTSTNLGLMCLAQGHNTATSVRLKSATLRSRIKHSTTKPLCSLSDVVFIMLLNFKMSAIVGILTFMSRINFVLSRVQHEIFITSGPVRDDLLFPS